MKDYSKQLRLLPAIGIALGLVGYLFIFFQTTALQEKKAQLNTEIEALEKMRLTLITETKQKDVIITSQDSIIAHSTDQETVRKGKELYKLVQDPASDRFLVTPASEANADQAKRYEMEGYQYLLNKDVDDAIRAFRKSENSYNSYHQVYEIAIYLDKNRSKLSDKNSALWPQAWAKIKQDYGWKMPPEIKTKIDTLVTL